MVTKNNFRHKIQVTSVRSRAGKPLNLADVQSSTVVFQGNHSSVGHASRETGHPHCKMWLLQRNVDMKL